uniref:Uncharacterized protein n=1 Tax=viral metagenome TaxID=1070528 RepID=A0A6C0JAZ1_9ZZZZ
MQGNAVFQLNRRINYLTSRINELEYKIRLQNSQERNNLASMMTFRMGDLELKNRFQTTRGANNLTSRVDELEHKNRHQYSQGRVNNKRIYSLERKIKQLEQMIKIGKLAAAIIMELYF